MRILFTMFFSVLACLNLLAQYDTYPFEKIDNSMGLSQGRIYSIAEDSIGFMWFGTMDGLNRYNGSEIKVFKRIPSDTNSISNNLIRKIIVDHIGNLWVGTDFGLNIYNHFDESFKKIFFESNNLEGLANNSITDLKWFRNKIYATTLGGGFYLVDPISFEIICLKEPEKLDVKDFSNQYAPICPDSSNRIWFHSNNNLYYYDLVDHDVHKVDCEKLNEISSILEISKMLLSPEGNLLISTYGEAILEYNPTTNSLSSFLSKKLIETFDHYFSVYDFLIDGDIMYIGTNLNGLYKYNMTTLEFENFKHDPTFNYSLSSNNIRCLLLDSNGLLWLGTNGRGINILAPSAIRFDGLTDELVDPINNNNLSVRALLVDEDNNIWVGGYNSLYRINGKERNIKSFLEGDPIYSLLIDPKYNDTLWVGIEGAGLIKLNVNTGGYIRYFPLLQQHPILGSTIYKMLADSNIIWAGTEHGLNKYDILTNENHLFSYDPKDTSGIIFGDIIDILKDDKGNIWVGSNKGGIGRLDVEKNVFKQYIFNADIAGTLSSNSIKDIFQDTNGTIWIATTEGLNRYNADTDDFDVFNKENYLPLDVIYGILEDNNNNLWLSTNEGICRFNPQTHDYKRFDKYDGLQSNEFNSGAYYKSKNGEMFFGGINGYNSFHPERLHENRLKPRIVFTKLKKFNKEIKLVPGLNNRQSISFDYDDAIFTIEFSALNFTKPTKNQYAYKLEGLDGTENHWINIGNRNFFDFTGLKPGVYVFHVKGSNNDGVWNNKGNSIRIIINPPFWNTMAFKVSAIILIIMLIYFMFIFRLRRIKNQRAKLRVLVDIKTKELKKTNESLKNEIIIRKQTEEELIIANKTKDKFFSIIGHDLKSPLNSLLGFSELLHNEYDAFTDEEKKEFIKDIFNNTRNLSKLTENLLYWARTQTGKIVVNPKLTNLYNLIVDSGELLTQLSRAKEITISIDVNNNYHVFVDTNMISTVFRNIISNAIKFTPRGGRIDVKASEIDNYINVSICDTGIGIEQQSINNLFKITKKFNTYGTDNETGSGLGLIVCREFTLKNNGNITVESEPGKGSTFTIKLPKL